MSCSKCGVELSDANWPLFLKKRNTHLCKECNNGNVRDWQKRNWAKTLGYKRKWDRENPEKIEAYHRTEQWRESVRKALRKEYHRRERELPTDTILNEPFEEAHLHHLTPSVAVYIPKGLHRSVFHNLKTGQGMDVINRRAMLWLKGGS
jgi:hypothetical protein